MPTIDTYETIDQLMDHCNRELNKGVYNNIYTHVLMYYSARIFIILQLDTNVPSKHDLLIIYRISQMQHVKDAYPKNIRFLQE